MFFLIFCIFEIFHNTKKDLGEGDTGTAISARVSISLSFCFSFVPSWEVNLGPVNGSGDLSSWTPSLSPSLMASLSAYTWPQGSSWLVMRQPQGRC